MTKQSKVEIPKCYRPLMCKYLEQASGREDYCLMDNCVRNTKQSEEES